MHVFVTGATGWVGTMVVDELLAAGHSVSGLIRSADSATTLHGKGATPVIGTLDDRAVLQEATHAADAVIHTAFNHDFSHFAENAEQDRRAIEGIGAALTGTDKPLIVTSGLAFLAEGRASAEADLPRTHPSYPRRSEQAAIALAEQGVRAATMRLASSVHGIGERGFLPILADLARRTGVSAYIGDGSNRWPAVHVSDAARLYRLALEQGVTEPVYHATAEEGVALKDIAEVVGRQLGLPVEPRPADHFGWFAGFAGGDMPASSAHTRAVLGWQPTGPTLLEDAAQPGYFAA